MSAEVRSIKFDDGWEISEDSSYCSMVINRKLQELGLLDRMWNVWSSPDMFQGAGIVSLERAINFMESIKNGKCWDMAANKNHPEEILSRITDTSFSALKDNGIFVPRFKSRRIFDVKLSNPHPAEYEGLCLKLFDHDSTTGTDLIQIYNEEYVPLLLI